MLKTIDDNITSSIDKLLLFINISITYTILWHIVKPIITSEFPYEQILENLAIIRNV